MSTDLQQQNDNYNQDYEQDESSSQQYDDQDQDQSQQYDNQNNYNQDDYDGQDQNNQQQGGDGNVECPKYIRLRGLPWSATHQEILDFLKNVNVINGSKGIHLVTSRYDGKNTGEAFVEVQSQADVDEAHKLNKGLMGHRYIEVFNANAKEAQLAMKKTGGPGTSYVVKLRGLPYSVTEQQVEEFFNGLEIKPDREGILFVMDRRGRATGEAYVQFESQEDTEQALGRNREKIGHRYIEIFRSSLAELRRAANGNGRPGPYDLKDRGSNRGDFGSGRNNNMRGGNDWNSGNFGGNSNNSLGFNSLSNYNNSGNFGNGFGNNGNFGNNNFGNNGGNNGGGFGGGNNSRFNGPNNGGNNFSSDFGDFGNFGNNRNNSNFNNSNSNDFSDDNNFGARGNNGSNFGSGGGTFGNLGNFGNFGNSAAGGGNMSSGFNGNMSNMVANNVGGGNGGGNFGPIGGGRNDMEYFSVHMRGLPYSSFENDVFKFFDPIRPANVRINFNKKGLHSGTADVYFDTYEDAQLAMKRHKEQMGNRYIELFFDGKIKGGNNNGGNGNGNGNGNNMLNNFSRRI